MRIIIGAVIGSAVGAVLVWFLAALSAVIGAALSFAGGYIEHRRAERDARRGKSRNGNGPAMAGKEP
jgi:UPF0716 family protein affecting phage T7 exclusion